MVSLKGASRVAISHKAAIRRAACPAIALDRQVTFHQRARQNPRHVVRRRSESPAQLSEPRLHLRREPGLAEYLFPELLLDQTADLALRTSPFCRWPFRRLW